MSWTWCLVHPICEHCGEPPHPDYPLVEGSPYGDPQIQVTYNFTPMQKLAGVADALRADGELAGKHADTIVRGLEHVRRCPGAYDELAKPNGDWGTREQFETQLAEMAVRCARYPKAIISVSN